MIVPIPNDILEKWKEESSRNQSYDGEAKAVADTRILTLITEVERLNRRNKNLSRILGLLEDQGDIPLQKQLNND